MHVMLSLKLKFSIVRFDDTWNAKQRAVIDKLIIERGIRIYSYLPVSGMLIGEGSSLAYATSYAVDGKGATFPVVREIVDGPLCSFDIENPMGFSSPPIDFENVIVGNGKSRTIGSVNIISPLFLWTPAAVNKALAKFGVTETVGEGLACCSLCLRPSVSNTVLCPKTQAIIPIVSWNAQDNWQDWCNTYGYDAKERSKLFPHSTSILQAETAR